MVIAIVDGAYMLVSVPGFRLALGESSALTDHWNIISRTDLVRLVFPRRQQTFTERLLSQEVQRVNIVKIQRFTQSVARWVARRG